MEVTLKFAQTEAVVLAMKRAAVWPVEVTAAVHSPTQFAVPIKNTVVQAVTNVTRNTIVVLVS